MADALYDLYMARSRSLEHPGEGYPPADLIFDKYCITGSDPYRVLIATPQLTEGPSWMNPQAGGRAAARPRHHPELDAEEDRSKGYITMDLATVPFLFEPCVFFCFCLNPCLVCFLLEPFLFEGLFSGCFLGDLDQITCPFLYRPRPCEAAKMRRLRELLHRAGKGRFRQRRFCSLKGGLRFGSSISSVGLDSWELGNCWSFGDGKWETMP